MNIAIVTNLKWIENLKRTLRHDNDTTKDQETSQAAQDADRIHQEPQGKLEAQ